MLTDHMQYKNKLIKLLKYNKLLQTKILKFKKIKKIFLVKHAYKLINS